MTLDTLRLILAAVSLAVLVSLLWAWRDRH
jgi:hypothetical protein